MTTAARLFPKPKELEQHGRARRFDPAAGIVVCTVGSGDFARAREVIADELLKAFPQVEFRDDHAAAWELRLSLGFRRPEPEAYRLGMFVSYELPEGRGSSDFGDFTQAVPGD